MYTYMFNVFAHSFHAFSCKWRGGGGGGWGQAGLNFPLPVVLYMYLALLVPVPSVVVPASVPLLLQNIMHCCEILCNVAKYYAMLQNVFLFLPGSHHFGNPAFCPLFSYLP